jgi:hypothetical protein
MTLILPTLFTHKQGGSGGGAITAEIPTGTTSGGSEHNSSSVTFPSLAFGTAVSGRQIVLGIAQNHNSSSLPSITSVTIGGVTATELLYYQGPSAEGAVAMYAAAVPSGTSGDVVVTYSGTVKGTAVFLWRVTGADTTAAHDTATDHDSDPLTGSIDCEAGGTVFAIFGNRAGGGGTSWSGVDDLEHSTVTASGRSGAANAEAFATAQTGLSVSYSGAGTGGDPTAAWVALSPA